MYVMYVFLLIDFFKGKFFQMCIYWNAQKTKSIENVLQYIFTIFVLYWKDSTTCKWFEVDLS